MRKSYARLDHIVDVAPHEYGFELGTLRPKPGTQDFSGICLNMDMFTIRPRKRIGVVRRALEAIAKISASSISSYPLSKIEITEFIRYRLVPDFWQWVNIVRTPGLVNVSMMLYHMEIILVGVDPTSVSKNRTERNRMLYDSIYGTLKYYKARIYMRGVMDLKYNTPTLRPYMSCLMDQLWNEMYPEERTIKILNRTFPGVIAQIAMGYLYSG